MCLEIVRRLVSGFQMQVGEQLDFHSLGEDRRRARQQVAQGSKVGCRDASELGSRAFVPRTIFLFLDPGTILASLQKGLCCLLIVSFRYILHHLHCWVNTCPFRQYNGLIVRPERPAKSNLTQRNRPGLPVSLLHTCPCHLSSCVLHLLAFLHMKDRAAHCCKD